MLDPERKKKTLKKVALGMKGAVGYTTKTYSVKKRCSTCVHFNGDKGSDVARCLKFKFLAQAKARCDAWKGKPGHEEL